MLLLCLEHLNPLTDLLGKLNPWLGTHNLVFYQGWDAPSYAFNSSWGLDYGFLPYAAIIVLGVGGIGGRVVQTLALVLHLLPLYNVFQVSQNWQAEFTIPVFFYAVSLLLYFVPGPVVAAVSRAVVQRLIPLGAISYGIYIIHFPILFVFGKVELFAGSAITFSIRALLYMVCVLFAAIWLDKVFQPWVRKRIMPAPSVPPPVLAGAHSAP